jgi:hypothetical protein
MSLPCCTATTYNSLHHKLPAASHFSAADACHHNPCKPCFAVLYTCFAVVLLLYCSELKLLPHHKGQMPSQTHHTANRKPCNPAIASAEAALELLQQTLRCHVSCTDAAGAVTTTPHFKIKASSHRAKQNDGLHARAISRRQFTVG